MPQISRVQQFRYHLLTRGHQITVRRLRPMILPVTPRRNLWPPATAVARPIAWIGLMTLTTLTFVPPSLRPAPALPHLLLHFCAFLLVGVAFAIGYPGRRLSLALLALPTTAILELLQLFAPGRHARVSDFVANAAGACIGVALTCLVRTGQSKRSPALR